MKKKLLLITLMVALFVCLLALGISAAEPDNSKETVTLDDGTVCALYDTDGVGLIWYISSTDEAGKNTYNYVPVTSESVYIVSTGGGSTEVNDIYVIVDEVKYDKNTLVVLNLREAKITSSTKTGRVGNDAAFFYKVFNGAKIEYFYANLNTTSFGSEAVKGCTKLKYVNFNELTNLTGIGNQAFISCTRLYENRVLDFTNTKLKSTDTNSLRGNAAIEAIFPETFTSLGQETFKDCKYVTKITFLGGLTSISTTYTFENCERLETVIGTGTALASITSIGDYMFKNCKALKNVEGMIVDGNLTIPSSVQSLAKEPFKGCSSLKSADLGQITKTNFSAFAGCTSLTDVIIPNTLTEMGNTNFSGCTSLKYVKVPNSVTTMGYGTFSGCTALEFVELSNALAVRDQTFSGCTSLKAVSIPEGVTSIEARAFNGCSSLRAVYLPSTLTSIGSNSGWGYGAFNSCTNLYFVSEPFEVKDENGSWLGNSFVMPSEPEVYYMPANLASINGNDFAYCEQINSCLVFPTAYTKVSTGAFINIGKNNTSGRATVVFLGKMTEFCYSTQDGRSNNITFIFAHSENTGIASLTKWYLPQTNKPSNCYAYFCAADVSYDLGSFGPSSSGYTATETDFTKTSNAGLHMADPSKDSVVVPADCLNNKMETTLCFCGRIAEKTEYENTALGHNFDLENGAVLANVIYANGVLEDGCKEVKCERCEEKNTEAKAEAIIIFLGYATDKSSTRITAGYVTNVEAYEAYTEFNTLDFGMVAYIPENGETTCTPLKAGSDGVELVDPEYTIHAALDVDCPAYDFIVSGFGEAHKDLGLAMCAYIYDGTGISYLCYDANGDFGAQTVAHTITISSDKVTSK